MRRKVVAVLLAGFCIFALCGVGQINVMSLGDSWAHGWVDAMSAVILGHGTLVETHNKGLPGTTAELWADEDLLLLMDAQLHLVNNPQIEWVVVSLGGNDLLDHYIIGHGLGDGIFDFIEPNLRAVIDGLLFIRPSLKIYVNGYDFLNFEMSVFCFILGDEIFGGNTHHKNTLMFGLTEIARRVAADYPQVYTTDTIGALQDAGGILNAPNFYLPSPEQYFPTDDCIHPGANGGWLVLMERIWDGFFDPLNAPTTTTTTTTTTTATTTTIPGDDDVDDDVDDDLDDDWLNDDAEVNDDTADDDDTDEDGLPDASAKVDDDDDDESGCCGA
jgi:lysophospholipase L1-like esterase